MKYDSTQYPAVLPLLTSGTAVVMDGHVKPPACILRARVLQLAADSCGIDAVPTKTRVVVGNSVYGDFCRSYGRYPVPGEEWERVEAAGAWSLGNAPCKPGRGRWDGHLVCRVAEWLLDPSGPDLTRLEHGIAVRPVAARWLHDGWSMDRPLWSWLPNGTFIAYHPGDDCDDSWMNSRDWRATRRLKPFVRAVVDVTQHFLESAHGRFWRTVCCETDSPFGPWKTSSGKPAPSDN